MYVVTVTTSSPDPNGINKMNDSFKNVFWYIIREMYHEKILPGWFAFFIPNSFKTQKICDEVVLHNPYMLGYISDKHKAQEICKKASEKDPSQLTYVSNQYKTQEICIKVVEKTSWELCHVPDQYKT